MKGIHLTGIIPPMITPLDERGEIDRGAVSALAQYLVEEGVDGLFILGTSGEGPLLTQDQCDIVIGTTVEAVRGRVPVLVGALETSTARTVQSCLAAEDIGADILVVSAPYYLQVDATTLEAHFIEILEHTNLPVMLYNVPSATHNGITLDVVRSLAGNPRVIGIKDSSGDMVSFQQLLELGKAKGLSVFQGAERVAALSLWLGCDGLVPGLANVHPALFRDLAYAVRVSEVDRLRELQQRVERLWQLHRPGHWLANLKWAMAERGFGSGRAVMPITPPTSTQVRQIRSLLSSFGLSLRPEKEVSIVS